jgi:hypothetical protein
VLATRFREGFGSARFTDWMDVADAFTMDTVDADRDVASMQVAAKEN